MQRVVLRLCFFGAAFFGSAIVLAQEGPSGNSAERADVAAFIEEMSATHGFNAHSLRGLFRKVRYQPEVIAAISRPVVAPQQWFEYAPQFLSPARIEGGLQFWDANAKALARAERDYDVAPEIIVAIIGVESFYGKRKGNYRVIDALTTLAFDYPRRATFFRGELEQFLLLTRERKLSPLAPKGSYAGAMGMPQFMPGSFRAYAIDYDGNKRIDLDASPADAIGSVAHYLHRHGWQPNEALLAPAIIDAEAKERVSATLERGLSARRSLAEWAADGVEPFQLADPPADDKPGLLLLEEEGGPTYWLAFRDWFVVTRYNTSRLYASAVYALANALRERHSARTAPAQSPIPH